MRQNRLPIVALSLLAVCSTLLPAAYADGMPDSGERTRYRSSKKMKRNIARRPAKVVYRDRIITQTQIVEKPVERIVEVEKIVEKPVIIEKITEASASVAAAPACEEMPLIIRRKEKKPFSLLRLHLFPIFGD